MKRNYLFWMIVPCLLFAGIGWYFWQKGDPESGPLRLFVDEAVVVPLTPQDVAEGWDTRVRVVTRMHGVPRFHPTTNLHAPQVECGYDADYTVVAPQTGKSWKWKSDQKNMAGGSYGTDSTEKRTVHILHLKTNNIPAFAGPLELQIKMQASKWKTHFISSDGNFETWDATNKEMVSVPVTVLVRPNATLKKPPQISRTQPFELIGFRNSWTPSTYTSLMQKPEITIVLKTSESQNIAQGYDFNKLGNARFILDGEAKPEFGYFLEPSSPSRSDTLEIKVTHFSEIYNTAKNVTFKADLSINECWPLPISVVLRKNGKNITRTKPEM